MEPMMFESTKPEFSVVQFFTDGTRQYLRRSVMALEAVLALSSVCNGPTASLGLVVRVIVTDGTDHCVFEWTHPDGVVWPTEFKGSWKPTPMGGTVDRPN